MADLDKRCAVVVHLESFVTDAELTRKTSTTISGLAICHYTKIKTFLASIFFLVH